MNHKMFRGRVLSVQTPMLFLLFLAACFLFGILLGHGAACVDSGAFCSEELRTYVASFQQLMQEQKLASASMGTALLSYWIYPVIAFLLGGIAMGVWLIPMITVFQGFSVSFSVSAFLFAAGEHSLLLAVCLFGLRCFLVLPCYFFLASDAMLRAARKKDPGHYGHMEIHAPVDTALRFAICLILLAAGAFLEHAYLIDLLYALLL